MNKKILLIVILAFTLSYHTKACSEPHTGFYIGNNLGYGSITGKLKYDFNDFYLKDDTGSNSSIMGFFLGYGCTPFLYTSLFHPNIYLGSEVFLQYENFKSEQQISGIRFQENNSFGIAAKIGYLFKDSLFFLKAGIESMGNIEDKLSLYSKGFLIGIGIDYAINHNWSIGGEIIYEKYNSIKLIIPLTTITYEPTKFISNIRLKYNF